jgi:hypothetical protein
MGMKIIIEGSSKEIADFVVAIQSQQKEEFIPSQGKLMENPTQGISINKPN